MMLPVTPLPDWLLVSFHFAGFLEVFHCFFALKDSLSMQQSSAR